MKEGVCVSKNIEQEIVNEAERQAEEIRETQAKPKDKFKTTVQQIMDTIPDENPDQKTIRVYVYAFFGSDEDCFPVTIPSSPSKTTNLGLATNPPLSYQLFFVRLLSKHLSSLHIYLSEPNREAVFVASKKKHTHTL